MLLQPEKGRGDSEGAVGREVLASMSRDYLDDIMAIIDLRMSSLQTLLFRSRIAAVITTGQEARVLDLLRADHRRRWYATRKTSSPKANIEGHHQPTPNTLIPTARMGSEAASDRPTRLQPGTSTIAMRSGALASG